MHAIFEILPVICGVTISYFSQLIQSRIARNVSVLVFSILSGVMVNLFSGEGREFLSFDIVLTLSSAFVFLLIIRFLFKRRI
jgi:hypothetical protein